MAEPDFPLINDARVSWARVKLQVAGETLAGAPTIRGYKAISYKCTVERTAVYAEGRKPHGYTDGRVAYEASVTFTYEAFSTIRDALNGGVGYMDEPITLTVSFKRETGSPVEKVTIYAKGMKESGLETAEGPDAIERVVPLDVVDILENDKSMVKEIAL